ncbi:rab11 family-interacting protein 4-like isoform X2 [Babylonia areolata]|uniref:rab11 family-interacting protein 4-like isoform X2 n=1 Tax=Babylonia areolata TaxID=304850 RepID=UPI003FD419A0
MEDHQSNADRYKAIFDLCDDDKDGYIDVDHFRGLAKDHFGAEGLDLEEITGVINLLDPEGRGLISYDDFCRGVEQIIDIQNQAQSSRIRSSVSVDTLVPLDIAGDLSGLHETVSPSSQSTYAEYDFAGLENLSGPSSTETPVNNSSFVDSLSGLDLLSGAPIGNDSLFVPQFNSTVLAPPIVSEDEGDSAISGRSSEINENRPEITDEENYEDFGEVESEADVSDQGLTPVTSRKRGEKKDILSRNHKKAWPKWKSLDSTFTNRRLTTAALASQLQRSSRDVTPSSTRRSSYGSDEIFDDIDGNFQDLNGRVKYLEGQLLRLTDSQLETTTKQAKLKEENSVLVNKVIYLEEQLRDMELRGEERITEERRKHQEQMARRDREKSEEQDYLTQRLHRVEGEYESLKGESSKMRTEVQKLRTEKVELQERMLEKQEMYNMLYDDNERLKAEYHKQEEMHQRERRSMGQLLDELGKELEELRKYKIEVETGVRSPSGNISELPGRYQELQGEIHKLKEAMWEEWRELLKENRGLQSSNDDLNAQLMNRCVAEGKSLLQDANAKSLAEELEQLTKEELMQQLRQEQDFSLRLKQYVDRIIITILEKNPSLLEIKSFGM